MADTAGAWSMLASLAPLAWLGALAACALLILALLPALGNFALAPLTQRSSHHRPTPQWGGLPIVAATLGVTALVALATGLLDAAGRHETLLLLLAALLMLLLGAVDDIYNLSPQVKLAVQAAAVALMLAALPADLHILGWMPAWIERALLLLGALWFVNLVNFMDGIDWMMVAEVVPITAGVAIVGALGALPPSALVLALALNGAMLGFAPFNRPVARLFMGDVGSLPIGLLLAWLLIVVAASGHLAASSLLPLYFVADTGVTLLRRVHSGERVWTAHRTHFYQRARDSGFTNWQIIARVFVVNVGLVVLAALSVVAESTLSHVLALLVGAGLVAWIMIEFTRPRS